MGVEMGLEMGLESVLWVFLLVGGGVVVEGRVWCGDRLTVPI